MIVRTLDDIIDSERDVRGETWSSRRLSLADDNMGFSMHDTIIHAGTVTHMWYQNHLEAVYCIEGDGTLEEVANGTIHQISAGTIYLLDQHDEHILRANTQMRMICGFNPPCTGAETHDENGVYPLLVLDPVTGDAVPAVKDPNT